MCCRSIEARGRSRSRVHALAAPLASLLVAATATHAAALSPRATATTANSAGQPPAQGAPADAVDRFTHARPRDARVTHVSLDLRVDFERRVLEGSARLTVAVTRAEHVVLDTNGLEIASVTDHAGKPVSYAQGPADPIKGRALEVTLPVPARDTVDIVVRYRTSPAASALQWLTPAQTAGRRWPFLLSQGQAILTRSWVPTQDSPGIRQTYDARIVVPDGLRAVMSAEHLTPDGEPVAGGGRAFRFRMREPIPPYLFAIAVGDIARREIGQRTAVFAEPALVGAAAHEFADLERMLATAETLYGGYRWGRYDVLVLPPSFPYGGMENPRLTFLTPTLLAGDRSLVSVVAHELAHSWSGNLVTNATWRDFWLNEGFTTYIELRMMEALYGAEHAATLESLERDGMHAEIAQLGPTSPATQLYLPDTGDDPDASLSDLAYSKGSAFLRMLERELGRPRVDAYLNGYFARHAFSSITTPAFVRDLRQHLLGGDEALERRLRIDEWLFMPGVPANLPPVHAPTFERVTAAAARFAREGRVEPLTPATWSTFDWVKFLHSLPRDVDTSRLDELERRFSMNATGNSEVLFAWLTLAIARQYDPAVPALERFLTAQGRRKFVEPLFQALIATDWGRPLARRVYARAGYHPVTAAGVDRLLSKYPPAPGIVP